MSLSRSVNSTNSRMRDSSRNENREVPHIDVEVSTFEGAEEKAIIGNSYFTNYVIELSYRTTTWTVLRRYKEFYNLNDKLRKKFPELLFPAVPSRYDDNSDLIVIERRREMFDKYLKHCLKNYDILSCPEVQIFLDFHKCRANIFEDLSSTSPLAVPLVNREIGQNYKIQYQGYSDLLSILYELHLFHHPVLSLTSKKNERWQSRSDGQIDNTIREQEISLRGGKREITKQRERICFKKLIQLYHTSPSACFFYLPQICEILVSPWKTRYAERIVKLFSKNCHFSVFLSIILSHIMNRERLKESEKISESKYTNVDVEEEEEEEEERGTENNEIFYYRYESSNQDTHISTKYYKSRKLLLFLVSCLNDPEQPTHETQFDQPIKSDEREFERISQLKTWEKVLHWESLLPKDCDSHTFWRHVFNSKLAENTTTTTTTSTTTSSSSDKNNNNNNDNDNDNDNNKVLINERTKIRTVLRNSLIFLSSMSYASQQLLSLPKDEPLRFECLREMMQWLDENFLPNEVCFPNFLNIKFSLNVPNSINDIDLLRSRRNAPFIIRLEYLERKDLPFSCFEKMISDPCQDFEEESERDEEFTQISDQQQEKEHTETQPTETESQPNPVGQGETSSTQQTDEFEEDAKFLRKLREKRKRHMKKERERETGFRDDDEDEQNHRNDSNEEGEINEDEDDPRYFSQNTTDERTRNVTTTVTFQQLHNQHNRFRRRHFNTDNNTNTMNMNESTTSLFDPSLRDSTTFLTSAALPQFFSWSSTIDRLAIESPFSDHKNWRVLPLIVKSDYTMYQEFFILQLLSMIRSFWKLAHIPLRLTIYRINLGLEMAKKESFPTNKNDHGQRTRLPDLSQISESNPMSPISSTSTTTSSASKKTKLRETGLVEGIPNAYSLHSIKKNTKGSMTLMEFFAEKCGGLDTKEFFEVQQNFVESTAAYSLISYFLNVKDRHNGNILIDTKGDIIHISYTKVLTASATDMSTSEFGISGVLIGVFDSAPFKLTDEMIEMMDGLNSNLWNYYCRLCVLGFLEIQKNIDSLCYMLDIMRNVENFPCFARNKAVIPEIRDRARVGLNHHETASFVMSLIAQSLDSPVSAFYDLLQSITNGIM